MRLTQLPCLFIAAALAAVAPVDAQTQNTIKRPAKIVIGFASGSLDTVARAIAEGVLESTGVIVIVDARPGASGRIAAEVIKSAAPDGTTPKSVAGSSVRTSMGVFSGLSSTWSTTSLPSIDDTPSGPCRSS